MSARFYTSTSSLLLVILILTGCQRGRPSDKPPVHIIQDMYDQPKYLPQADSKYFADGSAMRQPVAGTVARGELREDSAFYVGIDPMSGQDLPRTPLPMTLSNLELGQDRFDVFCSVCHGHLGDGQGIMVQKGYVPPPSFHTDRLRELPDGHFYRIIREGSAIMPSYAQQIQTRDRWAIVLYIRALQRSRNATAADVPNVQK